MSQALIARGGPLPLLAGHKGGKEERSLIHCALRFACPALSTNTSRNKQVCVITSASMLSNWACSVELSLVAINSLYLNAVALPTITE